MTCTPGDLARNWYSTNYIVDNKPTVSISATDTADSDADGTLRSFYARHGVDPARVAFVGRRDREGYLALLNVCDVALDTFPYNGHTTTLDALWMGVPVVTLAGRTHVSRCGASVLSAAGCPQWVAATADEYVRVASELAGDLPSLAGLRCGLRAKVAASPLNDGRALAAKLEGAYRAMWAGRSTSKLDRG